MINIMRHYKTVTKMFPFSSHTLAGSEALCVMVIWPALVTHLSMAVKAADYTQWSTAYTLLHTHLVLLEFSHLVENVSTMTSCHIGQ